MPNETLSFYTVNGLSSMSLTLTQTECEAFWVDVRRERSLATGEAQDECHGRFAGHCRFLVEPGVFLVINWEAERSVLDGEVGSWEIADSDNNPRFDLEGAILLDAIGEAWPVRMTTDKLNQKTVAESIQQACSDAFAGQAELLRG